MDIAKKFKQSKMNATLREASRGRVPVNRARRRTMAQYLFSFVVILAISSSSLFARSEKRVMLLDFKNVLKKSDYDYLEASLTDAVRNRLKEKFVYREIEKSEWQSVAKQNYVIEEDLYTFTAAMNLGINAQPDVAIFGGFFIESKRGSSQQEIRTRVRILDLNERKEIADFEMKSVVDASIFETVEKIADRIAKEAAAVLPGKEAWAKGEVADKTRTMNQISIRGGYSPLAFGAKDRRVGAGTQHGPTDVQNMMSIGVDFQHFGFFSESLGVFFTAGFRSGRDSFSYIQDGSAVPVTVLGLSGNLGITWRQYLATRFYFQPFIGGGINYDTLKFDFGSRTVSVNSTSGQALSQTDLAIAAPAAIIGTRIGYALTRGLFLEIGATYGAQFYSSGFGQVINADVGVGFKI